MSGKESKGKNVKGKGNEKGKNGGAKGEVKVSRRGDGKVSERSKKKKTNKEMVGARKKLKKSKPKFNVLNAGFRKKVKERWRKPRGTHNKKRIGFEFAGASPNIGYKSPESVRGVRPDGLKELLVYSPGELDCLRKEDADVYALRIGGSVGAKKRAEIVKKAEALGFKVVNPTRIRG